MLIDKLNKWTQKSSTSVKRSCSVVHNITHNLQSKQELPRYGNLCDGGRVDIEWWSVLTDDWFQVGLEPVIDWSFICWLSLNN